MEGCPLCAARSSGAGLAPAAGEGEGGAVGGWERKGKRGARRASGRSTLPLQARRALPKAAHARQQHPPGRLQRHWRPERRRATEGELGLDAHLAHRGCARSDRASTRGRGRHARPAGWRSSRSRGAAHGRGGGGCDRLSPARRGDLRRLAHGRTLGRLARSSSLAGLARGRALAHHGCGRELACGLPDCHCRWSYDGTKSVNRAPAAGLSRLLHKNCVCCRSCYRRPDAGSNASAHCCAFQAPRQRVSGCSTRSWSAPF